MTKVKHHFVPAFHLALFTRDGNKKSPIWVFDQSTGKQWEATPESIGYEKFLYTVEIPGSEPDVMEDVFKEVEDMAAPVIKTICSNKSMQMNDVNYNWLINYIALLAERTPVRMEHFTRPIKDISKIISQMIVSTPERFDAIKSSMNKEGIELNDNVSYEKLKDFISSEKYTLTVHNNTRINMLMKAIDTIIPYLGYRKWAVVYSPPEIGDFICSDNPISLHWIKEEDRGIWSSPGHAMTDTEVTVPLSSRIMLLGRFGEVPPLVTIASEIDLVMLNSFTGRNSHRFLYTKEQDFLWYKKDKTVGNVADFKREISLKKENN